MNLEGRVEKLENKTLNIPTLTGVLNFHPTCIFVDGKEYQNIEDVPEVLREKYSEQLV